MRALIEAVELRSRIWMLISLVAAFCVQTFLIYDDPVGQEPLSDIGLLGREIWHDHNCQSCHQLFGYGGFLGPDLTNLASRRGELDDLERDLTQILETGSAQMPAFPLTPDQYHSLAVFFAETDAMGVGQVSVTPIPPAREIFATGLESIAQEAALPELVEQGAQLAQDLGCITCHLPNSRSTFKSTDLTLLHSTLSAEHIQTVLTEGVPAKGMPGFNLPPEQKQALTAFIEWLDDNGAALRSHFYDAENAPGGSLWDLPWFEYR